MKIQLAIDRVSLGKAIAMAASVQHIVDIIEVGTSLIKEYGMLSIREIRQVTPDALLLADMKIMDEAAYEAHIAFENGSDMITVMGAASPESIAVCAKTATQANKEYMIDLMGLSPEVIKKQMESFDGIFCFHMPTDSRGDTGSMMDGFGGGNYAQVRKAIAGGVTLELLPAIKQLDFTIAVIGGAITKSKDMVQAALQCKEVAR